MTVSSETYNLAMDLIKEAEDLKLKVYNDTEGYPTIGYGHKMNPNEKISNNLT